MLRSGVVGWSARRHGARTSTSHCIESARRAQSATVARYQGTVRPS
ncbi:hypothetical protein MYA_4635 [Burkholderia sp. KJ006]|nr:hypothetical protein MYA_4635 [Burkholderia sp. KJ006]